MTVNRAAHEAALAKARTENADLGCQLAPQIMSAPESANTARLMTSTRPAWAADSPASTQHITAAPVDVQASSSAPTNFIQCGGAAATSTSANTAPPTPMTAVVRVRRVTAPHLQVSQAPAQNANAAASMFHASTSTDP